MRVRRTFALRKHVADTDALKHGTHGASGDYAGTGSGRTDHHQRTAVTGFLFVRDRSVQHGNFNKVFLRIFNPFGNGGGHFAGFAEAVAYDAVFVTYHNDCRKAECATTLGYLGNALDAYEPVFKLEVACTHFLYVRI